MALFTRLGRALRADAHDVLDQVETPASALRQALRDMEDAHAHAQHRAAAQAAQADDLARRAQALDALLADLADPLDTCLATGRDDLARPLLRRRLTLERTRRALNTQRARIGAALETAQRALDENGLRLEAMRDRLAVLAGAGGDRPGGVGVDADSAPVREAEVEAALLAEKQRRGRS